MPQNSSDNRKIRQEDIIAKRPVGEIIVGKSGKLQLQPCDKKQRNVQYDLIDGGIDSKYREGDIVVANLISLKGRSQAEVVRVLGNRSTPGILSTISILERGLSNEFSQAAMGEVQNLPSPKLEDGRVDDRAKKKMAFDGADTRDRDDAIYAEALPDGGFYCVVSISDVSYYVRPGSEVDQEAYKRGNSTYLPDMVVPMLPRELSNGVCSLDGGKERLTLDCHMWIDKDGNMTKYEFKRSLSNIAAALTYDQLQDAMEGQPDAATAPFMDRVEPLHNAYKALRKARDERGALDLEMPEHKVSMDDKGNVADVQPRDRTDSHKIIEEFMILANVAAASALESKNAPCVYRVHNYPPSQDGDESRVDELREYLKGFGLELPAGKIMEPEAFRDVIEKAKKMPEGHLIMKAISRVQAKAKYDNINIGHFGLALEKYAHFTSPIRRYSDLLVHRSLIDAFNLGAGGLTQDEKFAIGEKADHVSETEKLSANAERSAHDRFSAAYYEEKVGDTFRGRIVSIIGGGLFVRLDASGTDGLLPIGMLQPRDFYEFDQEARTLTGKNTGLVFRTGDVINVRIKDANALMGSITLQPVNGNGQGKPFSSIVKTPQRDKNRRKKGYGRDRHNKRRF